VEAEGIRRALREVADADHVLYVVDGANAQDVDALANDLQSLQAQCPITVVVNKVDLKRPVIADLGIPVLYVSATARIGLDELQAHLRRSAGQCGESEDVF